VIYIKIISYKENSGGERPHLSLPRGWPIVRMIASGKEKGEERTSSPLPGARSQLYLELVQLKV